MKIFLLLGLVAFAALVQSQDATSDEAMVAVESSSSGDFVDYSSENNFPSEEFIASDELEQEAEASTFDQTNDVEEEETDDADDESSSSADDESSETTDEVQEDDSTASEEENGEEEDNETSTEGEQEEAGDDDSEEEEQHNDEMDEEEDVESSDEKNVLRNLNKKKTAKKTVAKKAIAKKAIVKQVYRKNSKVVYAPKKVAPKVTAKPVSKAAAVKKSSSPSIKKNASPSIKKSSSIKKNASPAAVKKNTPSPAVVKKTDTTAPKVASTVCPIGTYRKGDGCSKFPSVRSCNAEVKSLGARNREEDAVRAKELAVLQTIQHLLAKLNSNVTTNLDEDSMLDVKDMVGLLQTMSDEERQYVEVNGSNGIIQLLKSLQDRLLKDGQSAKREETSLKQHCTNACTSLAASLKSQVNAWTTKRTKATKAVTDLEDNISRTEAKFKVLRGEVEKLVVAHAKAEKERAKQFALIEWLRGKLAAVRAVKNIETVSDLDLAPIIAGLDEDDTDMVRVATLLRRPHPQLNEVDQLLNEVISGIAKQNKDETDNINKEEKKAEELVSQATLMKTQRKSFASTASKVATKLQEVTKSLNDHRLHCANFGVL